MSAQVLVVEDEPKIADLICKYLSLENFQFQHVTTGEQAIEAEVLDSADLILLDIMLPGIDGITVCSRIREQSQVPIIMLTARIEEVDRLLGFSKGADDYVCKPFHPKELIARIRAVLKRSRPPIENESRKIVRGALELNSDSYMARCNGKELTLTKLEFSILSALMNYPNKVFSREELLGAVQGKYTEGYERNIDTHIKNLRKKLDEDEDHSSRIKSIYGIGYRLGNTQIQHNTPVV